MTDRVQCTSLTSPYENSIAMRQYGGLWAAVWRVPLFGRSYGNDDPPPNHISFLLAVSAAPSASPNLADCRQFEWAASSLFMEGNLLATCNSGGTDMTADAATTGIVKQQAAISFTVTRAADVPACSG